MKRVESPHRRRKYRRWAVTQGGNRITKIKALLVGDRNVIDSLPPDHPRRRVSLPVLRFPKEEVQS